MMRRGVIAVSVAACAACGGENNEGDPTNDSPEPSDPVRCLQAQSERVTNFATGSSYTDATSIRSFTYTYPSGGDVIGEFLDVLHVTGTVSDFAGIGISFGACVDAARFSGISFDLWGDAGPTGMLIVYANTRENSPEPPFTETGTCRPADPLEPYRSCSDAYARVLVPASRAPLRIDFSWFMGGEPHSDANPAELLAFFFSFDWNESQAPFPIDLSLSDVTFHD